MNSIEELGTDRWIKKIQLELFLPLLRHKKLDRLT